VRAYVAAGPAGLRILELGDAPTELNAFAPAGFAYAVAISDSFAYLANGPAGLSMVDVSDPAMLAEVPANDYAPRAGFTGVALSGDYVYLADGAGGLVVLRSVEGSPPPAPTLTSRVRLPLLRR